MPANDAPAYLLPARSGNPGAYEIVRLAEAIFDGRAFANAVLKCSCLTGLGTKSSMPAARHFSRQLTLADAVIAMIVCVATMRSALLHRSRRM